MDELIGEYTSGTETMHENARLLPVNTNNTAFGQIRPLTRAHEYYHVEKGGANGVGAAVFNTLVPVKYRTYPVEQLFPRYDATSTDAEVDQVLQSYDYVLVWGEEQRLKARAKENGFNLIQQSPNLSFFGREAR